MIDPTTAVTAYMAAWGEVDEAERRELLETGWADDGVYLDPSGRAEGRDALVAHIAGFQRTFADHAMQPASGFDHHDRYIRFAWKMFDPSGKEILEGVDFGEFDDDGRLKRIVGFFGPWPALG